MKLFFLALVCAAMVFLGVSTANAASWRCTVAFSALPKGAVNWTLEKAQMRVDAPDRPSAAKLAAARVIVEYMAVHGAFHAEFELGKNGNYSLCSPDQRPPIAPPIAPKITSRTWVCRVQLTWQVGAKKGNVDETWSDIDAASEAEAMGKAIMRSQNRLLALTLAGTRPAWPKTDAKCS